VFDSHSEQDFFGRPGLLHYIRTEQECSSQISAWVALATKVITAQIHPTIMFHYSELIWCFSSCPAVKTFI